MIQQSGLMRALEKLTAATESGDHCPPCCADLGLPQPPDLLKGRRRCPHCGVEWWF
jgi:hypothetical protein